MKTYQEARIYKIFDTEHPDKFYVGASSRSLSQRLAEHRRMCKRQTMPLYRYINENNCAERMTIELLEMIQTPITKEMLNVKEGTYIRALKPTLNKNISGNITMAGGLINYRKQYKIENKELFRVHRKKFYNNHKDAILEERAKFYEDHKDDVEFREKAKQRFKNYLADPEKRKKHNEYMMQKVKCPLCDDCLVSRCNMTKHRITKAHQEKLAIQLNQQNIPLDV